MENNQATRISDFLFCMLSVAISILYLKGFYWHDDTRILLQVVENMYQGHGAGYTQGDRVQVHSSPLWTYFLLFFRVFTSNYRVVIILGSLIPLIGVITWFRLKYRPYSFFLLIVLFSSNLLFSFWGSGLDNPLTYALLTILFYAFAKDRAKFFIFIAGLLLLNRVDAIFYIAPLSIWFIMKRPFKENLINFVKYAWPFYIHLLFAFVYYGTIFPNSYYSKFTSVKISLAEHFIVFARYVFLTIKHSPLDILYLVAPVLLYIFFRPSFSKEQRTKAFLGLAAITSTLLYFFWVGFEHLNPRFLGVLSMLSLLVVFEYFAPLVQQALSDKKNHISAFITLAVLCVMGASSLYLPLNKLKFMDDKDLSKNPGYYKNFRSSYENYMFDLQIICSHQRLFQSRPEPQLQSPEESPHVLGFTGEAGLALEIGSNFNNVDFWGITDPLMARIRTNQTYYYPGHNFRPIPRGYPETLMEGNNQIVHPELATYYDRLKNVVSGNLFSASRFKDIFYIAMHEVPLDPNDPEDAIYFLEPADYNRIFLEDYGLYRHYGDEWDIYMKGGEKSKPFSTGYWKINELIQETSDSTHLDITELLTETYGEPRTNGPILKLRSGTYDFEIEYQSPEATNQVSGKWMTFLSLGEEHIIQLNQGSLPGTAEQPGKVTGTFSISRAQDMARFTLGTFAKETKPLMIKGFRLTRLKEEKY